MNPGRNDYPRQLHPFDGCLGHAVYGPDVFAEERERQIDRELYGPMPAQAAPVNQVDELVQLLGRPDDEFEVFRSPRRRRQDPDKW